MTTINSVSTNQDNGDMYLCGQWFDTDRRPFATFAKIDDEGGIDWFIKGGDSIFTNENTL